MDKHGANGDFAAGSGCLRFRQRFLHELGV
jgi:hypothetical protein